ncbi:MAG: HIT domain-containing protein [Candidatus Thiodiazotropha sp.]
MTTTTINRREVPCCLLCNEVHVENALSRKIKPLTSSTQTSLAESPRLLMIPDISPVVPGHSLIITKYHCTAFSQISPESCREVQDFKSLASGIIKKRYGIAPFFFEHGTKPGSVSSAACISHAHIHVLPARINVTKHLSQFSQKPITFHDTREQDLLNDINADYLYYEDSSGMACLIRNFLKPLPRQFIRRIVVQEIGISASWNWRESISLS